MLQQDFSLKFPTIFPSQSKWDLQGEALTHSFNPRVTSDSLLSGLALTPSVGTSFSIWATSSFKTRSACFKRNSWSTHSSTADGTAPFLLGVPLYPAHFVPEAVYAPVQAKSSLKAGTR